MGAGNHREPRARQGVAHSFCIKTAAAGEPDRSGFVFDS
jgi:hypothetical protein